MNHRASKIQGLAWLAVACAVGALFATGLAPLIRAIPWQWEEMLADTFMPDEPDLACRPDPRAEALLQQMVKRLYPLDTDDRAFSIAVRVVNDPAINAYAELGGRITLNSGLVKQAESPEEIAGVLAHEIGHVHHRDILQGFSVRMLTVQGMRMIFSGASSDAGWAGYFLNMGFTRAQEAQADEDGLTRLQKAHIDNSGFRRFFERMEETGSASLFLSDHPSNQARIDMAQSFGNKNAEPVMTQADWKIFKHYCSRN